MMMMMMITKRIYDLNVSYKALPIVTSIHQIFIQSILRNSKIDCEGLFGLDLNSCNYLINIHNQRERKSSVNC